MARRGADRTGLWTIEIRVREDGSETGGSKSPRVGAKAADQDAMDVEIARLGDAVFVIKPASPTN